MSKRVKQGEMPNSPTELLDEAEQTKIMNELKIQASNQSLFTRKIFRILFFAIAFMMFICLCYSLTSPWEMNHQSHFKEHIPHWFFTVFYCSAVYCFTTAAFIVQNGSQYFYLKLVGFVVALLAMIGWLVIFNMLGVTHPALYWLPFVNLTGVVLATYVDNDTNSLIDSAEGLSKYKYNLKGV